MLDETGNLDRIVPAILLNKWILQVSTQLDCDLFQTETYRVIISVRVRDLFWVGSKHQLSIILVKQTSFYLKKIDGRWYGASGGKTGQRPYVYSTLVD